ncbi:MAG TPA: SIS domain-containing protein [Firmicutes bacterium]|nr:SIS domain-containing protein [Bacillota bacterium]
MLNVVELARKVIMEEAEALRRLSDTVGVEYERAVNLIAACRRQGKGRVVVTGIGKAGLIGRKIAASLASTGTPAYFVHPAEGLHGDSGAVTADDVVIALSNSGETGEVLAFLDIVEQTGAPVIAITGNPGSSLGRLAAVTLQAKVEREVDTLNLAPTASAVAALAVGDALTVCLMAERGFTKEEFARFHPGGDLGRRLRAK